MSVTKLTQVEKRRNTLLKTSYHYNTIVDMAYRLARIFHTEEVAVSCADEATEEVVDKLYGNEFLETIQFRYSKLGDDSIFDLDAVVSVFNGDVKYTRKRGIDFLVSSTPLTEEELTAVARTLLTTFVNRPHLDRLREVNDAYVMGNIAKNETVGEDVVLQTMIESIRHNEKIVCGRDNLTIEVMKKDAPPIKVWVK